MNKQAKLWTPEAITHYLLYLSITKYGPLSNVKPPLSCLSEYSCITGKLPSVSSSPSRFTNIWTATNWNNLLRKQLCILPYPASVVVVCQLLSQKTLNTWMNARTDELTAAPNNYSSVKLQIIKAKSQPTAAKIFLLNLELQKLTIN